MGGNRAEPWVSDVMVSHRCLWQAARFVGENAEARSREEGPGKLKGPGQPCSLFSKSGDFQQFLNGNKTVKEAEGNRQAEGTTESNLERAGTFL